jgi:hypothetical protein
MIVRDWDPKKRQEIIKRRIGNKSVAKTKDQRIPKKNDTLLSDWDSQNGGNRHWLVKVLPSTASTRFKLCCSWELMEKIGRVYDVMRQ